MEFELQYCSLVSFFEWTQMGAAAVAELGGQSWAELPEIDWESFIWLEITRGNNQFM